MQEIGHSYHVAHLSYAKRIEIYWYTRDLLITDRGGLQSYWRKSVKLEVRKWFQRQMSRVTRNAV